MSQENSPVNQNIEKPAVKNQSKNDLNQNILTAAPDKSMVSSMSRLASGKCVGLVEGLGHSVLSPRGDRRSRNRPSNNSASRLEESSDADDDEDDDDDDEDDDDETPADTLEGVYNPADFEHLVVSSEIKEIFQYTQRYTPQLIDLETRMKPFIPDYIAAVGDIDAFLKVPRPDAKPDNLGLVVLDEPSANQSDPTVLDLQLRAISKQKTTKEMVVRNIENADKNSREIDKWVKGITELHRSKPPPTVHYVKPMPTISSLMSEWPPAMEETLRNYLLPTAELDCSLKDFVDIVCALMDIPVYKSRIHSLHLLFTLYSEFKNSQHFKHRDEQRHIQRKTAS